MSHHKKLEVGQFVWVRHPSRLFATIITTTMGKIIGRLSEDVYDIEYRVIDGRGHIRAIYSYFLDPLNALELLAELPETVFKSGRTEQNGLPSSGTAVGTEA